MRARECVRAHTHRLHVWQVTRCMEHGFYLLEHLFYFFEHEFYLFEHEFNELNERHLKLTPIESVREGSNKERVL